MSSQPVPSFDVKQTAKILNGLSGRTFQHGSYKFIRGSIVVRVDVMADQFRACVDDVVTRHKKVRGAAWIAPIVRLRADGSAELARVPAEVFRRTVRPNQQGGEAFAKTRRDGPTLEGMRSRKPPHGNQAVIAVFVEIRARCEVFDIRHDAPPPKR